MKLISITQNGDRILTFDQMGAYVIFFENISGTFTFEITTSKVDLYIFGLYLGTSAREFHIETIQHHVAPGSTSNLLIKGVFDDRSKFVYQGLIRLEKSAQQSHAYQKNQNLVLSPHTFVDSRPFLEILANDVFCTHGSTTGKINEESLLYVESRGVTTEDARRLIVQGFTDEVYDKVRALVPEFAAPKSTT